MADLPQKGPTLDRLVKITIGGDLAVSTESAGTAPPAFLGLDGMSVKAKRGYSLNKLYSAYHGPCMRVMVGNNGPQYDIGFVDNKVDQQTLLDLSGPDQNLVYVVRWYDQSGNGQDAVATAFVTGFPVVVGSGVLIHVNGWPQIHINRSSLLFNNVDAAQTNFTLVSVFSTTDTGGNGSRWFQMAGLLYADAGGTVNDFGFGIFNGELTLGLGPADSGPWAQSPGPVIDGLLHAGWATRDQSTTIGKIYLDSTISSGQQALSPGPRTDSATCAIGSYNGTYVADFVTCEDLVFDTVLDDGDMQLLRAWQAQYTDGQLVDSSDLLLHFDSMPMVDSGKYHLTPNVAGLQLSLSQYKFGPGSNSVGGGHSLFVDDRLILGTQDLTIDCWVRLSGLDVFEQYVFDSRLNGTTSSGLLLAVDTSGFVEASYGTFTTLVKSIAPLAFNTWTHLEIGRNAGILYLFVDGVLQGTLESSFDLASNSMCVASAQYFPIGIRAWNGYLDEFHIKIGQCLHTANFTPRTAPYGG